MPALLAHGPHFKQDCSGGDILRTGNKYPGRMCLCSCSERTSPFVPFRQPKSVSRSHYTPILGHHRAGLLTVTRTRLNRLCHRSEWLPASQEKRAWRSHICPSLAPSGSSTFLLPPDALAGTLHVAQA